MQVIKKKKKIVLGVTDILKSCTTCFKLVKSKSRNEIHVKEITKFTDIWCDNKTKFGKIIIIFVSMAKYGRHWESYCMDTSLSQI